MDRRLSSFPVPGLLLLAGLLLASPHPIAAPAPATAQVLGPGGLPEAGLRVVSTRRCMRGTLGDLYCAKDEQGVAIEDALGRVRCAPGACMEVEVAEATEWDSEWLCSSVSGGEVHLTPDGPSCEGGCQAPRTTNCTVY